MRRTTNSRRRRWALGTGAGAVTVLLAIGGCSGDGEDPGGDAATATVTNEPTDASTDEAMTDEPADDATAAVTLDEAQEAALAEIGEGEVTWSGPEDDRGAAWEIEVTRPDGSEVDVLVAADGSIVKTVDRVRSPAPEAAPPPEPASPTNVTLDEAKAIALAAVGEGTVTWSGPEDDRGAAWEIEVTRPDGTEVDVLVAADGSVVS